MYTKRKRIYPKVYPMNNIQKTKMMNNTYKFLLYLLFPLLFASCKQSANERESDVPEINEELFTFVDLGIAANAGVMPDAENKESELPVLSQYQNIPQGIQVFKDSLIPFKIEKHEGFGDKSVIMLGRSADSGSLPVKSFEIRVNEKLSELYFLHTVMGAYEAGYQDTLVNYRIFYKDSTEVLFLCREGDEIDDCWETQPRLRKALRTYQEGHHWLVNTPWRNPYPGKEIKWIRMESTGNAVPVLIAITGTNDPGLYDSLMSEVQGRLRAYQESILKIALVQTIPEPDVNLNLQKGENFVRRAKDMGAQIVVFPEMFSLGYATIDFDKPDALEQCNEKAVSKDGEFVNHFRRLAEELEMAILITYLEKRKGDFRNSATLIDRRGNEVMTYSKVHTLDFFKMEASFAPGESFLVDDLDTRGGPVKTGIMICYDREFPESARVLMLKGAELILTPNACGLDPLRINQFQVRAWENAVVVAMANYVGDGYNGHSCAFNANGDELLIAGEEEGIFMVEVNMTDAREIRERTYWGNAFRRPHKYKEIVSTEVQEPFIRKNVYGEPFVRELR